MKINWPKLHDNIRPAWGDVCNDVWMHTTKADIYVDSDIVTTAHEVTHKVNNDIRLDHQGYNGFYLLKDLAYRIKEPATTIREVASKVPKELIGRIFKLYLVDQAGAWNNQPLYICDEWVAYTNGTACGLDLEVKGLLKSKRADTVGNMLEMTAYSMTLFNLLREKDSELSDFYSCQLDRVMVYYVQALQTRHLFDEANVAYFNKLDKIFPLPIHKKIEYGFEKYL
jgi:hypothetical protein